MQLQEELIKNSLNTSHVNLLGGGGNQRGVVKHPEITVLFLIYNSSIERIKKSLNSIIMQKDIRFQIVVADDGSKDNHEKEIENYFIEHGIEDYILVMNKENKGTVKNILSGIEYATGKYIRGLSPGDLFYGEHMLRNWVDFMEEKKCDWSISEAIYYTLENGKDKAIRVPAHPQDIEPYIIGDDKRKRWNYVVLNDIALGASVISTTDIKRKYCKIISEKGVKYAEDNIWRLLMFEGNVCAYYPHPTILYEYGSGISTSHSHIWGERLKNDWVKTDELMEKFPNKDDFQTEMLKAKQRNISIIRKILIKGKLLGWIKSHFNRRMTECKSV